MIQTQTMGSVLPPSDGEGGGTGAAPRWGPAATFFANGVHGLTGERVALRNARGWCDEALTSAVVVSALLGALIAGLVAAVIP